VDNFTNTVRPHHTQNGRLIPVFKHQLAFENLRLPLRVTQFHFDVIGCVVADVMAVIQMQIT
jgi:hypothetical protein